MVPTLIEALILDPLYWRKDGDDTREKKLSPIWWILMTLASDLVIYYAFREPDGALWAYPIFELCFRVATFDYWVNLRRGMHWLHLGANWTDRIKKGLPIYFRLFVELWFLTTGTLVYLSATGRIDMTF